MFQPFILVYIGTDKSNMVQTSDPNVNYPIPWEKIPDGTGLFENTEILWTSAESSHPTGQDVAVFFASAGYYECVTADVCGAESVETKNPLDQLLNNAPASFEGAVIQLSKGVYYYICSRNNNFTNRSQKGMITVTDASKK